MSRHAIPPPPGSFRGTWREARTYLKTAPPLAPDWWRWSLLTVTVGGAALILAFPASHVGTVIAVAGAAALLGAVFR